MGYTGIKGTVRDPSVASPNKILERITCFIVLPPISERWNETDRYQ